MLNLCRKESGASLIGMVIALIVVCLLVILGMRIYTGQRQRLDNETAKGVEQSGIQARGGRGVLEAARKQVADQEKLIHSEAKRLEEAR